MSIADTHRLIGGVAAATSKLIVALIKEGAVEYFDDELRAIAGESCAPGGGNYGNLRSAIRYVARVHGINWRRDWGQNRICRLDAKGSVKYAHWDRKHISRTSRRAVVTLRNTDYEKLPPAEQAQARALMAQLGTLAAFASTKTHDKLTEQRAERKLDMGKLLEGMKK